jgi:hypothetical protein
MRLQILARAGLKQFGQKGAMAIMQELGQLILIDIINGCSLDQLTKQQKQKALQYLIDVEGSKDRDVLTDANNGSIKPKKTHHPLQSVLRLCF